MSHLTNRKHRRSTQLIFENSSTKKHNQTLNHSHLNIVTNIQQQQRNGNPLLVIKMKMLIITAALSIVSNAVSITPANWINADYITVDFPLDDPRGLNRIGGANRWVMNQNADDPFYDWYDLYNK